MVHLRNIIFAFLAAAALASPPVGRYSRYGSDPSGSSISGTYYENPDGTLQVNVNSYDNAANGGAQNGVFSSSSIDSYGNRPVGSFSGSSMSSGDGSSSSFSSSSSSGGGASSFSGSSANGGGSFSTSSSSSRPPWYCALLSWAMPQRCATRYYGY